MAGEVPPLGAPRGAGLGSPQCPPCPPAPLGPPRSPRASVPPGQRRKGGGELELKHSLFNFYTFFFLSFFFVFIF